MTARQCVLGLLALPLAAALELSASLAAPADLSGAGRLDQSPDAADVYALIVDAAHRWSLDERTLLRIAWCESHFDPEARGFGDAAGVFQFVPHTWQWASEAAGFAGASPFDARANVETAAWLYAHHGPDAWGCV